jgi:hypothetical protein
MTKNIVNIKDVINIDDLLFLSSFIDYCKDNGIRNMDKDILERLHKEKLVFPALKVYKGVAEFRKIYTEMSGENDWRFIYPDDIKKFKIIKKDKKKYYSTAGISMSMIEEYKKAKRIEDPSEHNFKPWKTKTYAEFYTSYKKLQNQYEFIYDKKQILAIKIALPYLNWVNRLSLSENNIMYKHIRERINSLYVFLNFYSQLEQFNKKAAEMRSDKISDLNKNYPDKKAKKIEWTDFYNIDFRGQLKKIAEKIMEENKMTVEYILKWRSFLAEKSLISEACRSKKIKRNYLKGMAEKNLIDAEDVNWMIHIINTFLFFLTRKDEDVKQVLGDYSSKMCVICGSNFIPNKENQVTCGSPYCVRQHKNQLKREKRLREK